MQLVFQLLKYLVAEFPILTSCKQNSGNLRVL